MELSSQMPSENTLNAYRKTIKALKEQISILESQLYEIQDPNENLLEICQLLQQEKQELLDEKKKLRNEIQRQQILSSNKLDEDLNLPLLEEQDKTNQIFELKKSLHDLQSVNQQLSKKVQNLESLNEQYEEKIQTLENQILSYQAHVSEKQHSDSQSEIESLRLHYESIINTQNDSISKLTKDLDESKRIIHNFLTTDFQPFSSASSETSDVSALKKRNEELQQQVKELNEELFDCVNNNPELQAALEDRKELKRENHELHERIHVLELQLRGEDQPLLGEKPSDERSAPFKRGIYASFQSNEKIDIRNYSESETLGDGIDFRDVLISDDNSDDEPKEVGFKLLENCVEEEEDEDGNGLLPLTDESDGEKE